MYMCNEASDAGKNPEFDYHPTETAGMYTCMRIYMPTETAGIYTCMHIYMNVQNNKPRGCTTTPKKLHTYIYTYIRTYVHTHM